MKDVISCVDFREGMKQLDDESVDLILTDPPYPKEYLWVWEPLAREGARVLKYGGSLVTLAGHIYLPLILNSMNKHLKYNWILCLKQNGGIPVVFPRCVSVGWKPYLWFVKGEYHGKRVYDVVTGKGADKTKHKWGQNLKESLQLIKQLTSVDDVVLDPFCGGGTTALAARLLNRRYITFDSDPRCVEIAERRLSQTNLTPWFKREGAVL